jgi:hypothetical protein
MFPMIVIFSFTFGEKWFILSRPLRAIRRFAFMLQAMNKLRRCALLAALVLSVLLFATGARAEGTESSPSQTTIAGGDILLDGHKIVNMLDDFQSFWDAAKGKNIRRQRTLWSKMVENKYPDYFNKGVYRNADPDTRRAMLDGFLQGVPARIDAIREFNKRASQTLINAMSDFQTQFPDYQQQRDIYIGLSLFTFDGAVRPVSNDLGLLDTLCLGADVLSSYSQDQLKITIVHELFHLYNFKFLFAGIYRLTSTGLVFQQEVMNRLIAAYVPLMVEGMAVSASEQIYPDRPLTMYLHLSADELDAQQEDISQNALFFLNMMKMGALPSQYEVWFSGESEGIPTRGGYLLGYEAVKRALAASTLEDLARQSPAQLGQQADAQLSAMVTDKLFVMSGQE